MNTLETDQIIQSQNEEKAQILEEIEKLQNEGHAEMNELIQKHAHAEIDFEKAKKELEKAESDRIFLEE